MLKQSEIKKTLKLIKGGETVWNICEIATAVSKILEKNHRYSCGLESLEVKDGKWSYNGIEQPNQKAGGFFESPDGQNGEFYYALKDVGMEHHFFNAEYHWGVRKGNIILTYTEGDIDVFERPVGYTSAKE